MTSWLIRYEAFPQWFSETFTGYRNMLERGPLILDSWMQITFKDIPIGYSRTWVDSYIESKTESCVIRNKTILNLKLMGQTRWINVFAGATLDDEYRLKNFFTILVSESYKTHIKGERIDDSLFKVCFETPAGVREVNISIPDDVVVYSPMTEMAVQHLKPGQTMRLRVLDPVSMAVSEVTVEGLRKETVHFDDRDQEATVLKLVYQGLEMLSWVDSDGRILRQETPFGWTMTACSAHNILTSKQHIPDMVDILSDMAVPCRGKVMNPSACRKLALQLNGISFDPETLTSHRQIIDTQTNGTFKMTVLAQPIPKQSSALGLPIPDKYSPYLTSTPSIQSDHPDMIHQAKAIIGNRTNSFEAAKAIFDWVYRSIEKESTLSLPSALDVLKQRQGDCNEHTYLFVALARAVGLPARIHVGIMYAFLEGHDAFYYHAWPSVYVGEWVEMDPTQGQLTVDATHISLAKGELGNQMKLLGLLGKVSVDILEQYGENHDD